jgi:hypothetical protein
MMLRPILLSGLFALMLSGCSPAQPIKMDNFHDQNEMSEWPWFRISAPIKFFKRILRDDGSIAFLTYDNTDTRRISTDYSVHIYPDHPASCSPSLIGTADLEEFSGTNGKVVWGRIGVTNVYDDYDDAVCAPPIAYPSTSEEKDAAWKGEFRTERAAYALCSEKDGKTVVICISQMRDDPALAKEIFETFRWNDE